MLNVKTKFMSKIIFQNQSWFFKLILELNFVASQNNNMYLQNNKGDLLGERAGGI